MKLTIFKKEEVNDFKQFVDFWSEMYNYSDEDTYNRLIGKEQFTKEDIQELYKWKNGNPLSEKKKTSLKEKIITKLEYINSLKKGKNFNIEVFQNKFEDVSAVWKIFLLHIINPNEFPIYDQHTHRAYLFIHGQNIEDDTNKDIPTSISNKDKENFYFNEYKGFIEKYKKQVDLRKIDKALFAFGQTLKQEQFKKLFLEK